MALLLKLSQHIERKELRQKQWHFRFPSLSMATIKRPFADWKNFVAEAISHHITSICFAG
jgi:hypothetical protein